MPRSTLTRALALASLALACRSAATEAVTRPDAAPTPDLGEAVEGATSATTEAPAIEPAPSCALTLPPPPVDVAPGPAYALVQTVGVVRIDDAGATVALERSDTAWMSMVVAADGALWVADREGGVAVIDRAGAITRLPAPPGKAWIRQIALGRAGEVWAVTDDIEWRILRLQGRRWRPERRRGDFPGRYDDNKFVDLAVADDGVWVSSWNGLWRHAGGQWRPIDAPHGGALGPDLGSFRGELVAGDHDTAWLRRRDAWEALAWPRTNDTRRALADVGVVAAPRRPGARIELGSIVDAACQVAVDPLPGSHIGALAVDDRGRTWVATDRGLTVLGSDGRVVAQWPIGGLPGLRGSIGALAVVGAGPSTLPKAGPVPERRVRGRLKVYRSGRPLVGATIELCTSAGDGPCPEA
ncbi:MAG: hypothetical protein R3B09_07415, partial [Nannocystaceae bacterium]